MATEGEWWQLELSKDSAKLVPSTVAGLNNFDAVAKLVETYGVKIDPTLHKEMLDRYAKLNVAPYKGFINPVYKAVRDEQGNITDVTIRYEEGYAEQMMRYSRDYSIKK